MPAFDLHLPADARSAVLFASPHSGREYARYFADRPSMLGPEALRSSEDALVDLLIEGAGAHGSARLCARAPRAFLDLNRGADELDPAVIEGAPCARQSARIASGLGVIPRVVGGGRAIYAGKIPLEEAEARIARIWRPYHAALAAQMAALHARFGRAILLDFHSMPSMQPAAGRKPDIILGDRFGRSASGDLVARIEQIFQGAGFETARNAPFAGAYIAEHYGRPSEGQHAVQIEIDRGLYQDPARPFACSRRFEAFRARLAPIIAALAALGAQEALLAAE